MSDGRAIYLPLFGCVFFGAIILVELRGTDDPTITDVPARGDIVPAAHREQRARVDELLATALDRPLFSTTRRLPQQPEGDASGGAELNNARLTGIVIEADHRLAIFAVAGAKPLELTEGEMLSGWRIETIAPREVSLSGPGGIKTLGPRVDTNPVAPSGSPRRAAAVAPTPREVAAEAPPGVAAAAPPGDAAAARPNFGTAPRPTAVRQPMPSVATKPPIPIPPRGPARGDQQR